jgi:hypothetical protein
MAAPVEPGDRFGLAGTTLADRYRVDRPIAEGGFAVVYRAVQTALDRPVALKVLKTPAGLGEEAAARFRERFAAEARTIARIEHPYIVGVHDYGVSRMPSGELAPWMTLEWLEGETLASDLDRRRGRGGRSVAETVGLLRPVIEALAHAHRRGVVHRDVKPGNIMVVATDAGPILRMLDFGIAKIVRAPGADTTGRHVTSGVAGFSPDYAAPEQVTFSRTGPWTDVHAVGLLFTELLTDRAPFSDGCDEGDEAHAFEQVMSPTRPTPRTKGVEVGRLEKVILRAVARSPRHRFRDAGELLEALDAVAPAAPATRPRPPMLALVRRAGGDAAGAPADPDATRRVRAPRSARAEAREAAAVSIAGGALIAAVLGVLAWTFGAAASHPSAAAFPSEELARAHAAALSHASRGRPSRPLPVAARAPAATPVIEPICPPPPPAAALPAGAVVAAAVKHANQGRSAPAPSRPGGHEEPCAMTINSVPWAEVWVDGRNTGHHTPFVDYQLPCGTHELVFKRPDLEIDEGRTVVIAPGETLKHRYTLTGVVR